MFQKGDNLSFKNKKTFWLVSIKLFFFPLYPFNIFKNTKLITSLAILISLRLVLQYFVISIPTISTSISLSWTPLIIVGWIFGPIVGFFTGILTDTLSYLIKPTTLWFWLYAIQEALVGFIAGIIGSLYRMRLNSYLKNKKEKYIIDLVINQFISIIFVFISTLIIFLWANENQSFENKSGVELFFFKYSKYIIISSNLFFFFVIEILVFVFYKKNRKYFLLIIWLINLSIILTTIFSFLLGPISASEYYKYAHNGKESPWVIKYGLIFYLIPRVIKESVKLPIQSIAHLMLIPIITMHIESVKRNLKLSW